MAQLAEHLSDEGLTAREVEVLREVAGGNRNRDIAERLRPTCMNMSDVDFEKMVARMALIEWKHLNDSTPTSQMQSH